MKKHILLILLSIFILPGLFSQNLSLSNASGPISNNDTVTIIGDSGATLIAHIYIKNNSPNAIVVKVKKVELSVIPGTLNYFCWNNCYDTTIYISLDSITIPSGSTNTSDFTGDYEPKGNIGPSVIRYVFFNANDLIDTVCVNVNFYGGLAGINEINPEDILFSDAFPNPATNVTSIKYMLPNNTIASQVIIRDLLGNTIKEFQLKDVEGKLVINTSDLNDGIYFYSLLINDRIYQSKKLIIRN